MPSAEDLIEGLRFYVKIAREKGLRVYIGTLLPIAGWRTYAEFRETLRNEVNTWIRTTDEIDGCIDFDRACVIRKTQLHLPMDSTAAITCTPVQQPMRKWQKHTIRNFT